MAETQSAWADWMRRHFHAWLVLKMPSIGAGDSDIWVGIAPSSLRMAARGVLSSDAALMDLSEDDHVAICLQGGQVIAAMRGRLLAGRIAAVWPIRMVVPISTGVLQRLFEVLASSMKLDEVALAQAVIDRKAGGDADQLRSLGFLFVAELLFVLMPARCDAAKPSPLEFERYCDDDRQRLVSIVDGTLESTADCARLNGVRSANEIVGGYIDEARKDFRGWFLVRHEGVDVGCLLLSDRPADELGEIAYMGLVQSARGHEFGTQIVEYGLRVTAQWGRRQLLAIVDEDNLPARRCYEKCGGFQWDRRVLMAKETATRRQRP